MYVQRAGIVGLAGRHLAERPREQAPEGLALRPARRGLAGDEVPSPPARDAIRVAVKYKDGWRPTIGWGTESKDEVDEEPQQAEVQASERGQENEAAPEAVEEDAHGEPQE